MLLPPTLTNCSLRFEVIFDVQCTQAINIRSFFFIVCTGENGFSSMTFMDLLLAY